jgi:hypothetical protein
MPPKNTFNKPVKISTITDHSNGDLHRIAKLIAGDPEFREYVRGMVCEILLAGVTVTIMKNKKKPRAPGRSRSNRNIVGDKSEMISTIRSRLFGSLATR